MPKEVELTITVPYRFRASCFYCEHAHHVWGKRKKFLGLIKEDVFKGYHCSELDRKLASGSSEIDSLEPPCDLEHFELLDNSHVRLSKDIVIRFDKAKGAFYLVKEQ